MAIRKGMWTLLVAVFMAAPVWAQQGPADTIDRRLEMLDERLDLTDEQEAKIRQIWIHHREEMQAWSANHQDATREERREYFRSRAADVQSAVQDVLTPEQVRLHAEFRETWRSRGTDRRMGAGMRDEQKGRSGDRGVRGQRNDGRAGRGMQRPGTGRGMRGSGPGMYIDRIADALDLSDAQQNEVREIVETHRAEGLAWRDANPGATREQLQAYHEGHFAQLKTELEHVLTPEQLDRFEEYHETRRDEMFPRKGRN